MPVMAPQRQAPTTTHTSNTVTNFDVAVRILIRKMEIIIFTSGLLIKIKRSHRIGVFEFESTNMNRIVRVTEMSKKNKEINNL